MATADRKWGQPYLTRDFFHLLGERLADRTVLMMADYQGELVAGALNLKSSDTLYGRNWGALGRLRFLHLEPFYYPETGRAYGRERVCQYVKISVVTVYVKTKH